MSLLNINDTIAIVACSNGQPLLNKPQIELLIKTLKDLGLNPILSEYIYSINLPFNGSSKDKGKAFMDLYKNPKPIFGYSDLTTVLNSVYSQTNNSVYLYQIRNLIYSDSKNQLTNFSNSLLTDTNDLFNFSYKFIQGESLSGITVGGNIRCLLKLAGTKYMPDFTDKILFLESMGGEAALMSAFFNQLKQMGVFSKVRGILLGTFTKMQENNISPTIEELLVKVIDNPNLPIAKTEDIGHGSTSKCLIIGKNIILN